MGVRVNGICDCFLYRPRPYRVIDAKFVFLLNRCATCVDA